MKPYYQDAAVTLHAGDALAILRELPEQSVQTCITSPPYWGLRDYGTGMMVWGGEVECEHEWGDSIKVNATNHTDKRRWNHTRNGRDEEQPTEKRVAWLRTLVDQGNICRECGGWRGSLGLEPTPELYVEHIVQVFREVRRVLRDDGTLWLNLGDSYATSGAQTTGYNDPNWIKTGGTCEGGPRTLAGRSGLKPKDLVGIPWRVAFALQADGWWLRSDIIWAKPNPMPESVTDRPTKAHEYLFLLAKRERYHYDAIAIQEPLVSGPSDLRKMIEQKERIGGLTKESTDPLARASSLTNMGRKRSVGNKQAASAQLAALGSATRRMDGFNERSDASEDNGTSPLGRNRRTVWEIATQPYPEAHFATFPVDLVKPCVLAGSKAGDTVLDPFAGSGTTCYVAKELGRRAIGIDLKADYLDLAAKRLRQEVLPLECPRSPTC